MKNGLYSQQILYSEVYGKNKQTDLIVFLADKSKRDVSFKINYRAEAILNLIIITVYSIEDFWTIIKLCVLERSLSFF